MHYVFAICKVCIQKRDSIEAGNESDIQLGKSNALNVKDSHFRIRCFCGEQKKRLLPSIPRELMINSFDCGYNARFLSA